jgi:membrane-associated protease RseP (regulator of RpoE activity)
VINVVLLLLTAVTTTIAGAMIAGVDPFADPMLLRHGLPFAATLMTILLAHEAGHYVMCRRYGVSASLPYFIPGPFFWPAPGTFGAFIRIRSRFPDRRALFDMAAAGPWAGFVVALAATCVGLKQSTVLAAPVDSQVVLGDSLLVVGLTRLVLGADPAMVLLSPVAYAGWIGFFVTSLNLIPVGQLDGGHVVYAALGRSLRVVSAALIAFLVWLGLRGWPGWLLWAVITTLLVGLGHPRTEDDHRPLGGGRLLVAAATFVIFVLTFVAEPFKILP